MQALIDQKVAVSQKQTDVAKNDRDKGCVKAQRFYRN